MRNRYGERWMTVGWLLVVVCLTPTGHAQIIQQSVGLQGSNQTEDVAAIQKRLNEVPSRCGGPVKPLDVDGVYGPNTLEAIRRFQKIQLGFDDGLIEPKRATETRLLEFENFVQQTRAGDPVAWGTQVTGKFKQRLLEVAREVDVDPDYLMAAMAFESAETFSPAIKNAAGSGATGLIQFMPKTATGLGTSTEALVKMTAVEQLEYVKKYFLPYRGRCQSLSDVYMAILWPAAIGKPESYVLFDQQKQPTTYQQNRGLDQDRDGTITKSEAAAKVQAKLDIGKKLAG